jgi:hypothetical protein
MRKPSVRSASSAARSPSTLATASEWSGCSPTTAPPIAQRSTRSPAKQLASDTCALGPIGRKRTGKQNASSAHCSTAGRTTPSTAQATNAPKHSTAGSGPTTINEDTQPSATTPRSAEPTCSGPTSRYSRAGDARVPRAHGRAIRRTGGRLRGRNGGRRRRVGAWGGPPARRLRRTRDRLRATGSPRCHVRQDPGTAPEQHRLANRALFAGIVLLNDAIFALRAIPEYPQRDSKQPATGTRGTRALPRTAPRTAPFRGNGTWGASCLAQRADTRPPLSGEWAGKARTPAN